MPIYRLVSGTGTGTGLTGDTLTPPIDETGLAILRVSVIDAAPNANGQPQKRITVTYQPPTGSGTLIGLWAYLDAPDTAGALVPADGLTPADGSVGEAGTFEPVEIGFVAHNPSSPQFSFLYASPSKAEYWRIYIVAGSALRHDPVVQAGHPGASESQQFLVQPPAAPIAGREVAPLVRDVALVDPATLSWAENPLQVQGESGDQSWVVAVQWTWPADDQNWQTFGGVNIVVDDGTTQTYIGNVDKGSPAIWQSQHMVLKPGTTNYTVWLISYGVNGNNNTLLTGITPSVSFNVTRQLGSAGTEYSAMVTSDGVHAYVTVDPLVGADGTQLLRVTAYWNAPGDPQFGGVELAVKRPADSVLYALKSGRISPLQVDISQPASVQTWRFYLRSIDINGHRNSVVDNADGAHDAGETPWIDLSVGNATGQLNLAKALTSSFDTDLAVSGGKLTLGNVSATKIVTGILQVGGGGSKVSIMKNFDGLGSLIGWVGDDTGVSGYVGAWFKQLRIGGASPAAAQITADASGNVTISGSLIVGAVASATTASSASSVPATGVGSGTLPSGVYLYAENILAGTVTAAISINSGGTFYVQDEAYLNGDVYCTASLTCEGMIVNVGITCWGSLYVNTTGSFLGNVSAGSFSTAGNIQQGGQTVIDTSGNVIARGGFFVNNGTTYTGQTCTVVGSYTIGGTAYTNLVFQGGILVSYS